MTRWDKAMWWLPSIQWSCQQLFKWRGSDTESLTWDSPGSWRRSDPTVARTRCCQSSSNVTAGPSGRKIPRCGTNALPLGWSDCGNPNSTWKWHIALWALPWHVLGGCGTKAQPGLLTIPISGFLSSVISSTYCPDTFRTSSFFNHCIAQTAAQKTNQWRIIWCICCKNRSSQQNCIREEALIPPAAYYTWETAGPPNWP